MTINHDMLTTRDLLMVAPKTISSAQNLGKNAIDLSLRAASEVELYDKVEESIRKYLGYVLFVRIHPESSPRYGRDDLQVGVSWYCRIQFIKPEDMATL